MARLWDGGRRRIDGGGDGGGALESLACDFAVCSQYRRGLFWLNLTLRLNLARLMLPARMGDGLLLRLVLLPPQVVFQTWI